MRRPNISPFLWFDGTAEEAAKFYVSIFPDSAITGTTPGPDGKTLGIDFHLSGKEFHGINGGPMFKFTEAISYSIECETQEEIDYYWNRLLEGGSPSQCGWLKDKYGLSWQVVPANLQQLLRDPKTAGPVFSAVMGMIKLDIAALEAAAAGK